MAPNVSATSPARSAGLLSSARSPWTTNLFWLVLPSLAGAIGWWWGMAQFVTGQVNLSTNVAQNISRPAVIAVIGLGWWIGPALLMTYLAPWRSVRWSLAAILSWPVFLFFPFSLWTALAMILSVVGLGWAFEQTFADSHNRLLIVPLQTIAIGLSAAVVGILLSISVLSYQQVTRDTHSPAATLSRLTDNVVTLIEQFLPSIYHGYQPTMTVDQLIGSQLPDADTILSDIHFNELSSQAAKQEALNQKLRDLGLDPNQVQADVNQGTITLRAELERKLNVYRQEAIDQARDRIGKQFGVTLKGTESMHQALTDTMNLKLKTAFGRYLSIIPVVFAIGVFFLLRLFSFLYTWAIVGFGWLVYKILRLGGIVRIATTTVPAQHLEWKK